MLMKDHLVKYEQLHTKIKDHQVILPDIPLGITEIFCDKKSLTEAAHSTIRKRKTVEGRIGSNQTKRLKKLKFKSRWIETKHKLADSLTKQGANSSRLVETLESGKF